MKRTRSKETTPSEILLALEAFGSESFFVINKKLLKMLGPQKTIFLSNLIDKFKYFATKDTLEQDNSFFLTHKDQSEQTGMNEYQLRKCKKELMDMGIISTIRRGIPSKEYYLLNIEKLLENTEKLSPLKFKGLAIKNLKGLPIYKENKLKKINKKKFSPMEEFKAHLPKEWIQDKLFMDALNDFCLHRKEKKNALTKISIKRLSNKLKEYPIAIAKMALEKTLENGYSGLFPESIQQTKINRCHGTDKMLAKQILSTNFNEKYAEKFKERCLEPALDLIESDTAENEAELASNLCDLYYEFEAKQKPPGDDPESQQIWDDFIPSPLIFIEKYIVWLKKQDWLQTITANTFHSKSKLVDTFISRYTKDLGFDILTGRSVH